ncbi:MAG: periplasmic heavy metal sensor [Thermodesulfobacteriota bacterium]
MMRRAMTIGAVILLAGTLAIPVFAQGPAKGRWAGNPGYGPGACWSGAQAYRGTVLTEEQQAKINELRSRHLAEVTPVRNELWAKSEEMRGLMAAETLDEGRVNALQEEINGLRSDLADKRTEMHIELRKIDPEARFAGRSGRSGYGQKGWGPGAGKMGRGFKGGYGPGQCWN